MKIRPLLLLALLLPHLAKAQQPQQPKEKEVDVKTLRKNFPQLLDVRRFSTVDIVIIGSKARLGIREEELKDFVTVCFKQLFKGYAFENLPPNVSTAKQGQYGTINLTLETYPIALSLELKMNSVGSERPWKTNELRVATNNSIRDARLIKTSVATMMAKAATTLRKMQAP